MSIAWSLRSCVYLKMRETERLLNRVAAIIEKLCNKQSSVHGTLLK